MGTRDLPKTQEQMIPRNHIAVVIHSLGGGGAERTLVDLTASWAARGDRVTLVTLSHATQDAYVLHPDITRVELDVASESAGLLQGIKANLSRLRALRKVFKTIKPDIAIGFMTTSSILTVCATVRLPICAVASEHTHPTHQALSSLWHLLRKRAYPHARAVVTLTDGTAQWFKTQIPRAHVRVIPNPVVWPLANGEPRREPPTKIRGRKRLLAVGRLHLEKGFDLLIEAFKVVAVQRPDWDLLILGEGGLRHVLQEQIDQTGLQDRISLPGRVGNVGDWYASSDMYVLSSRVEGLSNTLLEAMAMGLPVVSFDCDTGPRAIITHGHDGLLVRPNGNSDALAQALLGLIANETLQQRLRLHAPLVRERFSLTSVLGRWDELIKELA